MTLDQAITHAWEVSDEQGCTECGTAHMQLAFWLEELRERRKREDGIPNQYKMFYDRITSLHDCNDCGSKANCKYLPKWGDATRINCPLWKPEVT